MAFLSKIIKRRQLFVNTVVYAKIHKPLNFSTLKDPPKNEIDQNVVDSSKPSLLLHKLRTQIKQQLLSSKLQELLGKETPSSENVIASENHDLPPATETESTGEKGEPVESDVLQWLMSKKNEEEKKSLFIELWTRVPEKTTLSEEHKDLIVSLLVDFTGIGTILSVYKVAKTLLNKGVNKFKFVMDGKQNTWFLIGYVASTLGKEDLVVFVTANNQVVVVGTGKEVSEIVPMPFGHNYDPEAVTGTIMEGGALMVSFPVSKGGAVKTKGFQVKLV